MDGSQPYVLIYYNNNINSILQQPLIHTQKIKYISFDVSNLYIILGASSGGLYIFRREPCSFIQIIPNQEGSVIDISISPDEKYLAFSTAKKSLIIIQLSNTNNRLSSKIIYRDKVESPITCMKWNLYSTELFLGDRTGQICVVILTDFLAKTMFQPSCYPLMRLDSEIVQIDWNSSLLLVSTITRCYICDTEREEYRQAGQKLREGEFGICFLNKNESDTSIDLNGTESRKKGWFTSKSSDSENSALFHTYYQNLKIYCSRPGARLWEVQADGTVIKTLQFKDACSDCPSDVIQYDYDPNLRIQLLANDNSEIMCITFSKLFVIKKKFILTYKKDYVYILDPELTLVVAWCQNNEEIQNIRIIGSFIYLWCSSGNVYLLQLVEIEKFLMRTFVNKQYYLCVDLCDRYMQYLMNLVSKSNKLYLLNSLRKKIDDSEALIKIEPLLKRIQEDTENRQNAQILETGIFRIENAFISTVKCDDLSLSSTSSDGTKLKIPHVISDVLYYNNKQSIKEKWHRYENQLFSSDKNTASNSQVTTKNDDLQTLCIGDGGTIDQPKQSLTCDDTNDQILKPDNGIVPTPGTDTIEKEDTVVYNNVVAENKLNVITVIAPPITNVDPHLDMAFQYFTLYKISKNYNCPVLDDILLSYTSIMDVYYFVETLKTYLYKKTESGDYLKCDIWCYNLFLRYIDLHSNLLNNIVTTLRNNNKHLYLVDAFIELNLSIELACDCGYPLPGASSFSHVRYYKIGQILIEFLWNDDNRLCYAICKKVPYMYKVVINFVEPSKLLPLLVQFHDLLILEFYMYNFNNEQIEKIINYAAKMINNKKCLFCNQILNTTCMTWTDFAMVLLKIIGSYDTLKYLREYSDLIPCGALDAKFYHLCILSKDKDDFQQYRNMADSDPNMLQRTLKQYLENQFEEGKMFKL